MDCNKMRELISLYIDDELSIQDREEFEAHIDSCENCRNELNELQDIRELLAEPMVDLPVGFKEELHEKLIEASQDVVKEPIGLDRFRKEKSNGAKKKRFSYKTYGAIAAALLIAVTSASVVSNFNNYNGMKSDQAMPAEEPKMAMDMNTTAAPENGAKDYGFSGDFVVTEDSMEMTIDGYRGNKDDTMMIAGTESAARAKSNKVAESVIENRKIITTAYLNIDTENYDESIDSIIGYAESVGGYVQGSNTNLRYYNHNNKEDTLKYGNIVIRVPSQHFRSTFDKLLDIGVVVEQNTNTEDITLQYRETFDRAENLKVQEKSLRDIMTTAKEVKDVIEVERELTRVRGEIDALTGRLNRWDNLTSLATITINLNEVKSTDQITTIDDNILVKAKKGFLRSIHSLVSYVQQLFINVVTALPILAVLGIGFYIAYKILRFILKKFRRD